MGQFYPYTTKWKENVVVILNIYEARTIYILFYDNFMLTTTMNVINWKYE